MTWQNISVFTAQALQSGTVTADSAGMVTIPGVQILTGTGNRLVLNAGDFPPIVQAPIGATQLQAPTMTWSESHGAASYDVWISNLSTGQKPMILTNVSTPNYTSPNPMGIGRYRVWVRGIDAGNTAAAWSLSRQFTATPRTITTSPSTPGFSNLPVFEWQALGGASKDEVYIQNRTTQALVLSQTNITATSFNLPSALPTGDYRWWARGSNNSGIVGGWSLQQDFNVGGRPILLTPASTTSNRTPAFSWTPVQGADHFELWVSRRDGTGVVINLTNITANSYTPPTSLAPSEYRIWVRAVTSTGVFSSWSSPVDVTVTETSFEHVTPRTLSSILVTVFSLKERAVMPEPTRVARAGGCPGADSGFESQTRDEAPES